MSRRGTDPDRLRRVLGVSNDWDPGDCGRLCRRWFLNPYLGSQTHRSDPLNPAPRKDTFLNLIYLVDDLLMLRLVPSDRGGEGRGKRGSFLFYGTHVDPGCTATGVS